MADTTLLREVLRRMEREGKSISTPSLHGFCEHCSQNERYLASQIRLMLRSIADHADGIR